MSRHVIPRSGASIPQRTSSHSHPPLSHRCQPTATGRLGANFPFRSRALQDTPRPEPAALERSVSSMGSEASDDEVNPFKEGPGMPPHLPKQLRQYLDAHVHGHQLADHGSHSFTPHSARSPRDATADCPFVDLLAQQLDAAVPELDVKLPSELRRLNPFPPVVQTLIDLARSERRREECARLRALVVAELADPTVTLSSQRPTLVDMRRCLRALQHYTTGVSLLVDSPPEALRVSTTGMPRAGWRFFTSTITPATAAKIGHRNATLRARRTGVVTSPVEVLPQDMALDVADLFHVIYPLFSPGVLKLSVSQWLEEMRREELAATALLLDRLEIVEVEKAAHMFTMLTHGTGSTRVDRDTFLKNMPKSERDLHARLSSLANVFEKHARGNDGDGAGAYLDLEAFAHALYPNQ